MELAALLFWGLGGAVLGQLPFETSSYCTGVSACVAGVSGGVAPRECGGADGLDAMAAGLQRCFADAGCCAEWPRAVQAWRRLENLEQCSGYEVGGECRLAQEYQLGSAELQCPLAAECVEALPAPQTCGAVTQEWRVEAAKCFLTKGCCTYYPQSIQTYRLNRGFSATCDSLIDYSVCNGTSQFDPCPGLSACTSNVTSSLNPAALSFTSLAAVCQTFSALMDGYKACYAQAQCCWDWAEGSVDIMTQLFTRLLPLLPKGLNPAMLQMCVSYTECVPPTSPSPLPITTPSMQLGSTTPAPPAGRTCLTEGLCIEAVTVDAADQTITIAVS
jgi:hypothetical protein